MNILSNKFIKVQRGQTLVEVVVALGIVGISLVAMMTLVMGSRNLLFSSQDSTKATGLAQEGIEIVRHQKDIGCSFTDITNADGTLKSDTFVIEGDTNKNPSDEKIIVGVADQTVKNIKNFSDFKRSITIRNLNDPIFQSDPNYNNIIPNSGFQNDAVKCGKTPIDPDDYDCTDQYYYMTVTVDGPNGSHSDVSTIISKQ